MATKTFARTGRLRASLTLVVAAAVLCVISPLPAQDSQNVLAAPALPEQLPVKPSQPPSISIPVEPLGFAAPGIFYLGLRNTFVSLDFLDENRLLFTFRVPGLLRRDARQSDERPFRAVILSLPSGTVQAESLWTLHGPSRSVWMLNGGRFLVRDGRNLEMSDATLELKPFLRFPGPLAWIDIDPTQQFLATGSLEPAAANADAAPVSSPSTSAQDFSLEMPFPAPNPAPNQDTAGTQAPAAASDLVVRVLSRDSGKVLLVSRSGTANHLPINADGYLESLRDGEDRWLLNLNYFSGGSRILGAVDSTCQPRLDFVAAQELLAAVCAPSETGKLVLINANGRHLWKKQTSAATIWPLLVTASDGLRLAREVLSVSAPVNADTTLSQDDILGQLVEVMNTADGKVALTTAASPVLDGGGNLAISPSGRRVAVLNGGAIQVFDLPAPPPLAAAPVN